MCLSHKIQTHSTKTIIQVHCLVILCYRRSCWSSFCCSKVSVRHTSVSGMLIGRGLFPLHFVWTLLKRGWTLWERTRTSELFRNSSHGLLICRNESFWDGTYMHSLNLFVTFIIHAQNYSNSLPSRSEFS